MAKIIVMTTIKKMMDSATPCLIAIRTSRKIKKGIVMSDHPKSAVFCSEVKRQHLLRQFMNTSNAQFTFILMKIRPCVAHSWLIRTSKFVKQHRYGSRREANKEGGRANLEDDPPPTVQQPYTAQSEAPEDEQESLFYAL
jgi:hypothetical protein